MGPCQNIALSGLQAPGLLAWLCVDLVRLSLARPCVSATAALSCMVDGCRPTSAPCGVLQPSWHLALAAPGQQRQPLHPLHHRRPETAGQNVLIGPAECDVGKSGQGGALPSMAAAVMLKLLTMQLCVTDMAHAARRHGVSL